MPASYNETALGILLVLIQLDWPQQSELFTPIADRIRQRGSFHYPLFQVRQLKVVNYLVIKKIKFQTYVININILEEIMYLRSDHGGGVTFDIFATPQSVK